MSKFFKGLVRGRFAGHPMHVMVVHFPVALFPMALVLDGLAFYLQNENFALSGWYCTLGGAFMGWFAILFGVSDLLLIDPKSEAMTKGLIHGSLNFAWICVFSFFAFLGFKSYPDINAPSLVKIISEAIVVFGMFYSNHIGGELIYKYKIGLEEIGQNTEINN
jgi:uncharacterized membrane protein